MTFRLSIFFLLVIISSCSDENLEIRDNNNSIETLNVMNLELPNDRILSYSIVDGQNILENDIILTNTQIENLKNGVYLSYDKTDSAQKGAIGISSWSWTNSTVNFHITYLAQSSNIYSAINQISAATNITFNESSSGNYIDFVISDKPGISYSFLGMQGGRQTIHLSSGASDDTVIHEIGHALGLFHEQSRTDRDDYITINWNNIDSSNHSQFESKFVQNFGLFDFNSIMIYGSYNGFALTYGVPTMTKLDGSTWTRSALLSYDDKKTLLDMYPGANKINKHSSNLSKMDIGVNSQGDVVFATKNRFNVDIYKNNSKIQSIRTSDSKRLDITDSGSILVSGSFIYGFGKYRNYEMKDISAGGGSIYCLASNSKENSLFKKINGSWTKIINCSADRLTVDNSGKVWLIAGTTLSQYDESNNIIENITTYDYLGPYGYFFDIGSAGSSIYITTKNSKNSNNSILKYSDYSNLLITQPSPTGIGGISNLDGDGNGNIWY